jgi:outer membrane receptor protein involved in Fe transport
MRFTVEAYRTDNRDDILFQSVSTTSQLGYFANFPKTRNQGIDAQFSMSRGAIDFAAGYSYLKATYEAEGTLRQGERNVTVTPGTRIAGLPRHTLKLSADWHVGEGWTFGGDMLAVSDRGVLGNEDGLLEDPEEGEEPEAENLEIPGYAVFNLRASWKPSKQWEFYVAVNNVFDRKYETFGALGETVFSPTGIFTGDAGDAVFVAPGAPRNVWAGLRYRF